MSQFERALATLGIESICADSPHANARVKRANGVLQDRLGRRARPASFIPRGCRSTPPASGGTGLRGAAVNVLEHFDLSCKLLWRSVSLPFSALQKPRGAPFEQGRKEPSVSTKARPPGAATQPFLENRPRGSQVQS